MEKLLWGRKILLSEFPIEYKNYLNNLDTIKLPAMKEDGAKIKCLRCGHIQFKKKVQLQSIQGIFYYCPNCIELGRIQSNQYFYYQPMPKKKKKRKIIFSWTGTLTTQQKKVSNQLCHAVDSSKNFLIYAVTGAGKTEMLFQSIYISLKQGKRIGIASPRVDVILELFPRIQQAFPKEDIMLLHGKQTEAYRFTSLVLCTTHQLLRFYRAFDVLIIDEVDSFPFVGNHSLAYGVKQALKKKSSLIYLTATPTAELKRQMSSKKLTYGILPARFHRKALPVPQKIWIWNWYQQINEKKIPLSLKKLLKKQFLANRDTLLFCPNILLMKQLTILLKKLFPKKHIDCVSAEDPERIKKVINMRNKKYHLLLTTTILERGVTFKNIDVIILGANHSVFKSASLVQISGRVGRNIENPYGKVFFIHDGQTLAMKSAIKQIKKMNTLAKKEGLIDK